MILVVRHLTATSVTEARNPFLFAYFTHSSAPLDALQLDKLA
jgi:hypothetical protein